MLRDVSTQNVSGQPSRKPPTRRIQHRTQSLTAHCLMLPYFGETSCLPGPLPTKQDIEDAEPLPSIYPAEYRRNVLVRGQFVVKYGSGVKENEGQALLALERVSSIPSPRLYAMYREDDVLYLVMEFKRGKQLDDVWSTLSEAAKLGIATQLRGIMDDLRGISSPGTLGSVSKGPVPHRFFWSPEPYPAINGPFEREEDFSMAMAKRAQGAWDTSNTTTKWTSEWLARHLPKVLNGHRCVFTHGDFQMKNILVEESPDGHDESDSPSWKVTALLDWEDAGWYPDYWEYSCCFIDFGMEDDWPEKLEKILDPWPLEASVLKLVRQELDY